MEYEKSFESLAISYEHRYLNPTTFMALGVHFYYKFGVGKKDYERAFS